MDTFTRLIPDRVQDKAWRIKTRKLLDSGWLQVVLGLPFTAAMLFLILLLALPALLRANLPSWDRFGEH